MTYIDKWKDSQDSHLDLFRAKSNMLKTTINTMELLAVSLEGSAPAQFVEGYKAAIQTIEEIKEQFDDRFDPK